MLSQLVVAQDDKQKTTHPATRIPSKDPDYNLTGEFVGPISVEENKYEPIALQVRYIGDQNFEAIQYSGGLPGQKSHRPAATKLIGRRGGEFVVLSGGSTAVFVEKDYCLVVNRKGKQIGRLERIQRTSPTMGAPAPKGAVVLFDGSNATHFSNGQISPDGFLMEGADCKPMFHDFNLHLEFKLPYMPTSFDQARANSGVYLQSRYEVQILDSFATEAVFNGCGSLYRTQVPSVNMCLPPLQWQTYDIMFTAPRWTSDGKKSRNARLTVWQNGVKIHNNYALKNKTGAGKQEEPLLLPIRLQNHGNPVRFRNVWVVDRGLASNVRFPVFPVVETKKPLKEKKNAEKKNAEKKNAAHKNVAHKNVVPPNPAPPNPAPPNPAPPNPTPPKREKKVVAEPAPHVVAEPETKKADPVPPPAKEPAPVTPAEPKPVAAVEPMPLTPPNPAPVPTVDGDDGVTG